MNKNKWLIITGVIVLILAVIGGFYWLGTSQRRKISPAAAATPMPEQGSASATVTPEVSPADTVTTTPTAKPLPTWTPKPTPSSTPAPTVTPTPTPGVVNIEASVSPSGTVNSCASTTFTFTAKIYTNAATTVTYTWLRSDNASAPNQTLTYSGSGMQTVTDTWTLSEPSGNHVNGWERIHVSSPNDALSNTADFTLACP